MDSLSRVQKSKKLGAIRNGPFRVEKMIGKNSIKLEFPEIMRSNSVVHVEPTTPFHEQHIDI